MVEPSVETGPSCPPSISEPLAVVRTLQHERDVFVNCWPQRDCPHPSAWKGWYPHSTVWNGVQCEPLAAARLSALFSMKGMLSALYSVKGIQWEPLGFWATDTSWDVIVRFLNKKNLRYNEEYFPSDSVSRTVWPQSSLPNGLGFGLNYAIRGSFLNWARDEVRFFFFFVLLSIEHRFVQCVFARTISTRFAKVECSVFRVNRLLPKGKSICTTYGYVTDTSVSKNTHNGIITLWQTGTNMTITFFFFKLHLNFVQRSVLNTFLSACPLWGVCVSSKIFFLV